MKLTARYNNKHQILILEPLSKEWLPWVLTHSRNKMWTVYTRKNIKSNVIYHSSYSNLHEALNVAKTL